MSFFAGAVVGKAILDTAGWIAGSKMMSGSMGKLGKIAGGLGKAFTIAGTAIAATLVKATKDANEFQKAMSNVSTLVDTAEVNVQAMAQGIITMDSALGSATELTEGLYQALSASVAPAEAVDFVAQSAQFAKAALVDTNTAVDVITTGLNAYGLEADNAGRISDVLFQTIKTGKVTGDQLASTIGNVIPLAANMDLSFENLGASMAIMTRQGISSAKATTQLQGIMRALLKPSEDMAQAMSRAGFETGEAVTSSDNFQEALKAVIDQTDGSQEALAKLFPNVRGLQGALALTGEGATDFSEVLEDMNNSAGATAVAFGKQEKTFETFTNTADRLMVVIGNISKSFVDELAVGATEAAEGMLNFILSSQGAELVGNIVGFLAGAFEAAKVAIEPIANVLGPALEKIWSTLTEEIGELFPKVDETTSSFSVFGKVVAFTVATIEVLADAVKLTIRLGGNLIDLFVELWKIQIAFIDAVADPFNPEKWNALGNAAVGVGESFSELITEVSEDGASLFDTLTDKITTFDEAAEQNANNIEIAYTTSFDRTSENIVSNWGEMTTGMEDYIAGLKEGIDEAEGALVGHGDTIKDSFNFAEEGAMNFRKVMKFVFDEGLNESDKVTQSMSEKWTEYFNDLESKFGKWAGIASDALSQISDIFNQAQDNKQTRLDNEFKKREEIIRATTANEEQLNAKLEQLAIEKADKERKLKEKAFRANKAIAIVESIINTGVAVTKTLSSIPFPFNLIAAGVVGAFGLVQTALIAAQPMPQFEEGGPIKANQLSIVGEGGPELFLPGVSGTIIPNDMLFSKDRTTTFNNVFNVRNNSDIEVISRKLGMQMKGTFKQVG